MAEFRMELRRHDDAALQENTAVYLMRALSEAVQLSDSVIPVRLVLFAEQFGINDADTIRNLTKALSTALEIEDSQERLSTVARTLVEIAGVDSRVAQSFATVFLDAIDTAGTMLPPSISKRSTDIFEIEDNLSIDVDSPGLVRLYDLLPRIYHIEDGQGYLRNFLWGFQRKLGEIYRDEKGLRIIQGISETPYWYLPYIAQSLGWQLQNKDPALQRNECASIADYYDLKGTPYGIRLLCNLTLDRLFRRLMEFYAPSDGSASTILATPNDNLASLLNNEGDFVDPSWNNSTYHYDPLYSYAVEIWIDPNTYTYGEIRPRVQAFKERIHTMHPAGRYCYPYIVCRGTRASHYKQVQLVYEEITGLKTFDDLGAFDDGGRFDENDAPIDQSLSTKFYKDWKSFDDGGSLDDDGFLDDGFWEVHGIFEIS